MEKMGMNLKRVIDIYEIIKERLPSTYPRPKLAFFEDEKCLLDNTDTTMEEDEANVYAVINPDTDTINLPLSMQMEHTNKAGDIIVKTVPITKQSDDEIAHTLLHEIAHAYFGEKFGYSSKQYSDESACNAFASRWIRVLRKEKLL
jgi:hypothetical protein